MPLLAGPEANAASTEFDGPGTGHPETLWEFAQRMKNHFVLKPPGERKVGKERRKIKSNTEPKLTIKILAQKKKPGQGLTGTKEFPDLDKLTLKGHEEALIGDKANVQQPDMSLVQKVSEGQDGLEFGKMLKGQYHQDTFCQSILTKPKEYNTFEVTNGLVYLKLQDKKLLMYSKISS